MNTKQGFFFKSGFKGKKKSASQLAKSLYLFVQLWDIRKKGAIHTFQNTYQVLAVTFNDTSDQILSGGIDNDIKVSPKEMLNAQFCFILFYFICQCGTTWLK